MNKKEHESKGHRNNTTQHKTNGSARQDKGKRMNKKEQMIIEEKMKQHNVTQLITTQDNK
jgi:hypothetical protein